MTKQEKINELLKDNQPIEPKAKEHISEMDIFKAKVEEQIERLHNAQMDLLNTSHQTQEERMQEEMTEIESEPNPNNEEV